MGSPVMPSEAEVKEIVLGPNSLVWRRFSDVRLFAGAGYALLLQVAHPTVGSGVRDHSTFEQDPWGRFLRTSDYLNLLVYGGREAAAMGRRLCELHKQIRGTNPDGTSYHALEPEAYAWVHATLLEAALRAHELFVGRLEPHEVDRFYAEYMPLGRLVGVRAGDIPGDWAGFREYFDAMVAERLEHNETVDRVLRSIVEPPAPPPFMARAAPLWRLLRIAPSRALRLATIGMLSPELRERFGVRWTRTNRAELRAVAAASRAAGPLIPRRLQLMGPGYLRWRADEIYKGPLGAGGDGVLGGQQPPVAHAA
ncbi:MAG: oxygenase MpaB family protein [Solirubrobacterales bacterium]